MNRVIRALIVDDEPPARAEVRRLLATQPDIDIIGECSNGVEAIQRIRADAPDLVFLDIQMPEVNGFGVVHAIGAAAMPAVIFITAYEEYAVRAFEAHALDYLLKPYDGDRLYAALDRARTQIGRDAAEDVRLHALESFVARPRATAFPELFAVRSGEEYRIVRVADIRWIEAEGSYVRLHLPGASHLMRQSITYMDETLLDPKDFLRIHRSAIVQVARITAVEPVSRSEYSVILDDGTQVTCSRGYRSRLRERVFFSS